MQPTLVTSLLASPFLLAIPGAVASQSPALPSASSLLGAKPPCCSMLSLMQAAGPQSGPSELTDAEGWRDRLGVKDLAQRETDFEALVDAARRDPRGRETLEGWSKDLKHADFAWTCRLALRELERSSALWPNQHGGNLMPSWPQQGNFFQFDPLSSGQGFQMLPLDPQEWIDKLHAQGFDFQPLQSGQGMLGGQSSSSSESLSLQLGPDGVKCTVKRDVDGKEETQEYEAKSMDELLRDHPELQNRLGQQGNFSLRFGSPFGNLGGSQLMNPWHPGAGAPMRTDVLGVYVRPLAEGDVARSGVDEGVGLFVESVAPNTLAQRLGIEAGQTVIELNGRTLKTRDDIREALAARSAGEELRVTLIDAQGERHTRTWRPELVETPSGKAGQPGQTSGSTPSKPAKKLRQL
jgi:hypothetical protein